MSKLLKLFIVLLPWPLKRKALERFFSYQIHPSAHIGLSFVYPNKLEMAAHSSIDHFTVGIHLESIKLGEHSRIGRSNWITGFPKGHATHFSHLPERKPELLIGRHSAITKHHHIDCTECIEIGNFVTIAGYHSQLLTHSIDIFANRQDAAPITISDYCFIGTNCVLLGGSALPRCSVLGAKSLLNKKYTQANYLYAGTPAKAVKKLPEQAKYFTREKGFVN